MKSVIRWMLMLTVVGLTGGCVTKALWTEADLDTWNEPAGNPRLGLFQHRKQNGFLVVYDEYRERTDTVRTRAYLIHGDRMETGARRRPHFVDADQRRELPPVPLFVASPGTGTNSAQALFAVAGADGKSFTIYSNGQEFIAHALPVYNDGVGRIKRIALTPFAVTADLTVVGGVLFLWVWSGGGLNSVH